MNRSSSRGLTVIELMIMVAIGAIIAVIIAFFLRGGIGGATGIDHEAAVKEARQFANDNSMADANVSCVNTDSDGDGYVSCTLSLKRADGSVQFTPIECAAKLNLNSGCKLQRSARQ